MFNEQEKEFLIKILSQITVSASDTGASAIAENVQAILKKLKEATV